MAALTRATASSMSLNTDGSGSDCFRVGARSAAVMPRATRVCASTSGISASRVMARATSPRPSASTQRRPENERATPNAAGVSRENALEDIPAPPALLDPAHRAGGRAHHDALGGDELAAQLDAGQ